MNTFTATCSAVFFDVKCLYGLISEKGIPREVERYQTIYANKSINPPCENARFLDLIPGIYNARIL
jgi:hypothetical protein